MTIARQILDLQQFKAFGIEPEDKSVVALRSMQHFRAAFEPIAGQVIVCDSGGLCTPRYDRLPYRNVPRPDLPPRPDHDSQFLIGPSPPSQRMVRSWRERARCS